MMLPTKFQVKRPFGLGEEAKKWQPSWMISNQNDISYRYFLSASHPNASNQVSSQVTKGVGGASNDYPQGMF